MLSLDQILNPEQLPPSRVPVPEWGGHAFIANLTADGRDEVETAWVAYRESREQEDSDQRGFRAYLVAATLCDDGGNLVFGTREAVATAAAKLAVKSAAVLTRLFTVSCALNAFSKEDIEALEKNCTAAQTPPTGSGPPKDAGSGESRSA